MNSSGIMELIIDIITASVFVGAIFILIKTFEDNRLKKIFDK